MNKVLNRGMISALIITAATAIVLGGFFVSWKNNADQKVSSNPILSLGEMENQGVPLFEEETITGEAFRLNDHRDKVVLINFWASWCAPCIDEFPSMLKLIEEFPKDVLLVAVSRDRTRQDIDSFLKAFPKISGANIKIIWDQSGEIAKSYGVDRLPESFLAKKDLKLSRKIIGTIQWHTPDSVEFIKSLIQE